MIAQIKSPLGKLMIVVNSLVIALDTLSNLEQEEDQRRTPRLITIDNLVSILMWLIVQSKILDFNVHFSIIDIFCKLNRESVLITLKHCIKSAISSLEKLSLSASLAENLTKNNPNFSPFKMGTENKKKMELEGIPLAKSMLQLLSLTTPSAIKFDN